MLQCTFEDGGKALLRHAAVDTIIVKDGKVLLVKRALELVQGGKWAIVGGFADRDETMAQTAIREAMEETGWKIDDPVMLKISDDPYRKGEDRQNVVFLYFADAVEKTGEPDWESTEQKWFPLDEIPAEVEMAFDHTEYIELYKKYLAEKFPLPVIG